MGAPTLIGIPAADATAGGRASRHLRIVTRCSSTDEFIGTFRRFVDEKSIFIVTNSPRPVGPRQPFALQLKDHETIMRGEAAVVESHTTGGGPGGRNGMRVELLVLDDNSKEMHQMLLRAQKASTPPPMPSFMPVATPPPPRSPVEEIPIEVEVAAPAPAAVSERPARPGSISSPDRAPGATYTLPANPFGELPPEALEYFVECTLYEDTGLHPFSEIGGDLAAAGGAEPADGGSAGASGGLFDPPPVDPRAATVAASSPPRARPATVPPAPIATSPIASFGNEDAPPPTAPAILDDFVASLPPSPQAPSMAGTSPQAVAVGVMPVLATERDYDDVPGGRGRGVVLVASVAALLGVACGLMGGYVIWSGGGAKVAAASTTAPQAGAVAPKPSEADPVDPPPTPVPTASQEPTPAGTQDPTGGPTGQKDPPPPVRTPGGTCKATIRALPDADVTIAGKAAGKTPLENIEVPCGDLIVVFERPRYERIEKTFAVESGTPLVVDEQMARPEGVLELVSVPPGATFTVGGAVVGLAPANAKVQAYASVSVSASLTGYKPWSQKLYVKGKKMRVTAQLEALAKPKPKPIPPKKKPAGGIR